MKNALLISAMALVTFPALFGKESAPSPAAGDVSGTSSAPAAAPADPAALRKDSSYALGYRAGREFGDQFGRFGIQVQDIDGEAFLRAFMDGLKGADPAVAEAALQEAMVALGNSLQNREKELGEANLAAGKRFLEDNAKREGVVTTKSGLQYEVLTKGGKETFIPPEKGKENSKVFQVNYRGTLIDGTEFDASPAGETVPMDLNVVPGFREALTTMPVGAKWKLFLPATLAYGEERRSGMIGPNSVLIFELELVSIDDAPAAESGGFPFPLPPDPTGEGGR